MASPSVSVQLEFSAKNLRNADAVGKSDPRLVVYAVEPKKATANFKPAPGNFSVVELFRTERIKNNLNPEWKNTYTTKYFFEEMQWLFLQVLDIDDNHSKDPSDQDFLGGVFVTLGQIMNDQENSVCTKQLLDKKQQPVVVGGAASTISVRVTVLGEVSRKYNIRANFTLGSTRMFKSDTPFFQVLNAAGKVVYESRKGHGKLSEYPEFTLDGAHAAQTTWVFAHNHSKGPSDQDFIGKFTLTEEQLNALPNGSSMNVVNDMFKATGLFTFVKITKEESELEVKDSIVHRLDHGLNISAVVAIDFTGSNGDPKLPHSLHYLAGDNQYRNAIDGIIPIISQYDNDKKYPVYGFGMLETATGRVNHAKLMADEAFESDGVVSCYESSIRSGDYQLSGPTHFAPMIREAIRIAQAGKDYVVLVIFTDGAICDMSDTIDAIVEASYLPMSLIIVGIGRADFGPMNKLDNDGKPPLLNSVGRSAKRDIVQFVPMRDCPDTETLRKATLAELPKQIMAV